MKNAARSVTYACISESQLSAIWGLYLGVDLLGHMVILRLTCNYVNSWRMAKHSPQPRHHLRSLQHARGSQLLHHCEHLSLCMTATLRDARWFGLAFPKWLTTLNIFFVRLSAIWLSLEKCLFKALEHFWIELFCYWVVGFLYSSDINPLSDIWFSKVLNEVQLINLLLPVPLLLYPRNHRQSHCH